MAEVISLSTFHGHNLTDQDHALFMQTVTSQSGLFYGCEVTLKDENTLHVSTGEGIACGRIFRIMDMDYPVELSASGDLLGRLYVHIDTALDDTPAQLMDVQGSTLPALIQEDDMNQGTGVYEIELATFSINELGISNLEFTAPKATGGGAGGKSIAPDYVATESYEKGRIFFQNGTLYRTIAAIPAGAPLVLDTNVVETSLAAEIEALNQNLTTRVPLYNPTDDFFYVNGQKTILRAGLAYQTFTGTISTFDPNTGIASVNLGLSEKPIYVSLSEAGGAYLQVYDASISTTTYKYSTNSGRSWNTATLGVGLSGDWVLTLTNNGFTWKDSTVRPATYEVHGYKN